MASPAIDLSGGFVPKQGVPPPAVGVDLSGGFVPKSQGPTSPVQPESEASRALRAPGEEIQGAIKGVGAIGSDVGKAAQGGTDSTVRNIAGKINPVAVVAYDKAKQLAGQVGDAFHAGAQEDSIPGKILGTSEKLPIVGDIVQEFEQGHPAEAITRGLSRAALMKSPVPEAEAPAALPPTTKTIAGAEIPLKTSQWLSDAGHPGMAKVAGSIEPLSQSLPGGGALQKVDEAQQLGLRKGLANVAAKSGAEVSTDPANIEKNFTDAAASTKEAAQAKYQHLSDASKGGDFSEPQQTARGILDDPETNKLLSKPTREALQNAAGGNATVDPTVDSVARQYYKKSYASLSPEQQVGLHKILPDDLVPKKTDVGMDQLMKARSELADAAYSKAGEPEGRTLSMSLKSLDDSIDSALQKHDAANGTNLQQTRTEANDLWKKMYATRELRDGLQSMMTSQPQTGARQISGAGLQGVINKLDPAGGKEFATPLQKFANGDPQTLKDLHDLADFAGKNQAKAGAGMSGMMAKFRMMSLPPALLGLGVSPAPTLGLLGSSAALAQILARPGIAKAMLGVMKVGSDATKSAASFGELVHAISSSKPDSDQAGDPVANKQTATTATSANADKPSENPGVQPNTSSASDATKTSSHPSPTKNSLNLASTVPPTEQPNATTPNKWVARAIDSAKSKSTLKPQGNAPNVQSSGTSVPPATLWQGKEGKTLTLKNPASGQSERWKLRNGTPILAQ